MALYYEMSDSIDQAIASLNLARELAVKTTKKGDSTLIADTSLVHKYHEVLIKRRKEIAQIEEYLNLPR